MENCDVSPSTLTGCVDASDVEKNLHNRFREHNKDNDKGRDGHQVRLQSCTVPEADPSGPKEASAVRR